MYGLPLLVQLSPTEAEPPCAMLIASRNVQPPVTLLAESPVSVTVIVVCAHAAVPLPINTSAAITAAASPRPCRLAVSAWYWL